MHLLKVYKKLFLTLKRISRFLRKLLLGIQRRIEILVYSIDGFAEILLNHSYMAPLQFNAASFEYREGDSPLLDREQSNQIQLLFEKLVLVLGGLQSDKESKGEVELFRCRLLA